MKIGTATKKDLPLLRYVEQLLVEVERPWDEDLIQETSPTNICRGS